VIALPGTIQAENFDNGGQNVAWWDSTGGNQGGKFRSTDVDIESCTEGGYSIGLVKAGEWLEYTVDVKTSGTYTLEARVASQFSGGAFHVEVNGADKTGRMSVPNTGGWQRWTTVSKGGISLSAGRYVLRLKFDANSSAGYVGNFNWLKLSTGTTTSTTTLPAGTRSAFSNIAASSFNASKGVTKSGSAITQVDGGDYVGYNNINFGSAGATKFSLNIAVPSTHAGKKVLVRIGGPTGTVVGTLVTRATGGWGVYQTQTISIARVTGLKTVYLTFEGGYGVGNMMGFKFA
jgi:hypothetical protein